MLSHAMIVKASRGERVPDLIAVPVARGWRAAAVAVVAAVGLLGAGAWAAFARDLDHPWPYHDDVTMVAMALLPLVIAGVVAASQLLRGWRNPMRPALIFGPGVVLRTYGDGRVGIRPMANAPPPVVSGTRVRMDVEGRPVDARAPDTTTARRVASYFAAHQHDPLPDVEAVGSPGSWPLRLGVAFFGAPLLILLVVYGAWTANFVHQVNRRWEEGSPCDFKFFAMDVRTQALDVVLELADLSERAARAERACPQP